MLAGGRDVLLHPPAQIAQRLLQHAQVADRVQRALLELVVAVQRVVGEPETEVLVECAAQVFLHLGAVPVGLPRESFPVEQRLDDDHLSLETT